MLGHTLAMAAHCRRAPLAPGMLASHYAPKARLRLNAEAARPGEALLAFGPAPAASVTLNLSPRGDLIEAAANLFSHLRALDASGATAHRGNEGAARGPGRGDQRPAHARRRAESRDKPMNLQIQRRSRCTRLRPICSPASSPSSATKYAITDPAAQEPYLVEMRDLYHGQHAGGAAAGLGRRGRGDPQARQRDQNRSGAAGRQHRPGRRANSASTARSCCRSRGSTKSARSIRSPTP